MKKIIVALVAIFTVGSFSASAQKIGHIEYTNVMDSLETYKTGFAILEEQQATFEETMKSLQAEYDQKLDAYQRGVDTLSDILKQLRENELMQIQSVSEQMQTSFQQSGQIIQTRYFGPLEDWLGQAVAIVGERKGLDYILYYNEENAMMWVNPKKGADVSNEVITEMLRLEKENPIEIPGQ